MVDFEEIVTMEDKVSRNKTKLKDNFESPYVSTNIALNFHRGLMTLLIRKNMG